MNAATGGSHAIVERPQRVRVSVECFCATKAKAKRLRDQFGGTIKRVAADWLDRCAEEQLHPPIRVGKRLVVVADSAQLGRNEQAKILFIPAGVAFGTGDHATTAMSLRLLEQTSRALSPGWRAFDAGTGTGILAFAAHCFGATKVVGVDNDPLAIKTARANADANKVRGVKFVLGDARRPPGTASFDLIIANLFSELLIEALPNWKMRLKRGGHLIISGVLRTQQTDVLRAVEHHGFAGPTLRRRGKWVAISAAK